MDPGEKERKSKSIQRIDRPNGTILLSTVFMYRMIPTLMPSRFVC
jgi:hypothetical protein